MHEVLPGVTGDYTRVLTRNGGVGSKRRCNGGRLWLEQMCWACVLRVMVGEPEPGADGRDELASSP
jgi:hypothetical protein